MAFEIAWNVLKLIKTVYRILSENLNNHISFPIHRIWSDYQHEKPKEVTNKQLKHSVIQKCT